MGKDALRFGFNLLRATIQAALFCACKHPASGVSNTTPHKTAD
jgi:hypothetical protein